jgi:hypothetical protein
MKKLVLAAVLSAFSFSAAAYACDGMKGHEKADGTQSANQGKKSQDKKADNTKSDQKT